MSSEGRFQQVKTYVIDRLRREVEGSPRGAKAGLARALGISTAHVSNLLSTHPSRTPGEDLCRKAATYWGVTYAELERLACGDPTTPPAPVPNLDELRALLREEIAAALAAERTKSGLHQLDTLPNKKATPRKS